jgi:hypothetical protein
MREANELLQTLMSSSKATERQKCEVAELGGCLPVDCTYIQANVYISDLTQDRDPVDGKPATSAQLKKIKTLGGDVTKAINTWRAETYIDELEELKERGAEELNERIDNAYDLGKDFDDKWDCSVKRPSKAIMKKAIQYGIDQGWGKHWDDAGLDNIYNPYSLIGYAIYCVAPELLKPNHKPPQMPLPNKEEEKLIARSSKGKGCMVPIMFFGILLIAGSFIKIKYLL